MQSGALFMLSFTMTNAQRMVEEQITMESHTPTHPLPAFHTSDVCVNHIIKITLHTGKAEFATTCKEQEENGV